MSAPEVPTRKTDVLPPQTTAYLARKTEEERFGILASFITRRMADRAKISYLERTSNTDPLTGVLNRRGMQQAAQSIFARHQRYGTKPMAMMIDLDKFKEVNDGPAGHDGGDRVLRAVAGVLTETVRPEDRVGRWGGDEFGILFEDITPEDALLVAERLRANMAELDGIDTSLTIPTLSIGLAELDCGALTLEGMYKPADLAAYEAKKAGGDQAYHSYQP
jgi:diguanylate cyclase (GGDEF)-like protein